MLFRSGKPSAYDRWMSTLLGCAAAREMIVATPQTEPVIIAERHNRISRLPMMEQIRATRAVKDLVSGGDYEGAVAARGASFGEMLRIFETMSTPPELDPEVAAARGQAGAGSKRVAIIHNSAALNLIDTNNKISGKPIDEILHLETTNKAPLDTFKELSKSIAIRQRDDIIMQVDSDEALRLEVTFAPVQGGDKMSPDGYVLIVADRKSVV